MKSNGEKLSREERLQRFYSEVEAWARGKNKRKPTPTITLPVSEKLAAAAKVNPESVRISARDDDGMRVVGGPLLSSNVRVCVEQVIEVDADGRPIWPKAGAVHEYNPLDRL
jgi:hypothetical protein